MAAFHSIPMHDPGLKEVQRPARVCVCKGASVPPCLLSCCCWRRRPPEKHAPLQSAKRKQLTSGPIFFCGDSPAPRRGSESELSFTAESQHSGFGRGSSTNQVRDLKTPDPDSPWVVFAV